MKGEKKTILKATLDRRYRDKNGDWKSSQSFSRNEIPLAIFCLQKAFEEMLKTTEDSDGPGPVEEEFVE